MGLYEFREEDAFRFAEFIHHQAYRRGNELVFIKCPYCGSETNKKSKFAINLETGQFNCFRASCGAKGNMITLSQHFNFQLSEDVDRYINRNNYAGRFKTFADAHRKFASKDSAIDYMKTRGISIEICRRYEITALPERENVIVFPFKDVTGELTFIKYRNTTFKAGDKGSKEWCEKDCKPILFGMNHCSDFGRLVITEGQIDSLSLAEADIKNACSVPLGKNAFTWMPHCWDWMSQFSEIVIFGDNEKGSITLTEVAKRFPKKSKIVRAEDYQGYKDANEILLHLGRNALVKAVENAEPIVKSRMLDMSTVEFVDIEKVETIKTNIEPIDKYLTGGFKVGTLTILSGKRGNGKSTVASYFGVEALAQGYNTFMYSGELTASFARNWVDRQIIGSNPLTNGQIAQAGDWYRNRLFIFDNNIAFEDEEENRSETEILLETMELSIHQKGVRFFILDNLMTAMDDVSSNDALYQGQRKFVRSLAKMAKKYDVVIILVAHPRKSNMEFENDSVSGSSVITDAADLVMSYDKITDQKDQEFGMPDVRKLTITKNRLTGKVGEVRLYFSADSKRITGLGRNFVRNYLNNSDYALTGQLEMEDIPFD